MSNKIIQVKSKGGSPLNISEEMLDAFIKAGYERVDNKGKKEKSEETKNADASEKSEE